MRLREYSLNSATIIEVQEELFDAGFHPEDGPGLPYGSNNRCGSNFLIIAEAPDGARWVNREVFSDGLHIGDDGDGNPAWGYTDRNAGSHAQDFANYIQAHLDRGGLLDPRFWTPINGAYGSAAWDESELVQWERQQDEMEGWR